MPVRTASPSARLLRARADVAPCDETASRPCRTPWWLWPHLLSLDAPLVAVVWQWWWGRSAHAGLSWCHSCVLGLSVWLIYLTDRLADSFRHATGDPVALRHAFHARWRLLLCVLMILVAATLAFIAPLALPGADFRAGLLFLTLAVAYFWLIHGRPQQSWTAQLPKEAVVGFLFAVGTVFFPWCRAGKVRWDLFAGVAVFGAICFCNCALITAWERQAQDVRSRSSLLNAFPRLTTRLRVVCLGLACLAGGCAVQTGSLFFLPLAASGLALAVLDHFRAHLSTPLLRVLADVVLLTPLLANGLL